MGGQAVLAQAISARVQAPVSSVASTCRPWHRCRMGCSVLGSRASQAHGTSFFTKLFCCGWGINKDMCNPVCAGDTECCCLECALEVNPKQCQHADQLCLARTGCKAGPCVADLTNPLVDKHELIVVNERKVCGP